MAKTKWATVTEHEDLGGGVHRLHCRSDEPLNHVAGNYVILRSTLTNPDKPEDVLKRALSISSAPDPDAPHRFCFTAIDVGPMSAWLAQRREGDRLEFSGPWGKNFKAQDDDADGPVHLFATGTGFSPIGAMAVDRSHSGVEPVSVWWQTDHSYDEHVLAELRTSPRFSVSAGGHVADEVPADPKALYFLAGDGAVIVPLCERLRAAGVPDAQLRTEFFFNKPPKTT
jgi:ferredoxin-NADP reductase